MRRFMRYALECTRPHSRQLHLGFNIRPTPSQTAGEGQKAAPARQDRNLTMGKGREEAAANLRKAAEDGNSAMAVQLLKSGVSANAQDSKGDTPLFFAAFRGHARIVEILLAHGARVDGALKGPDMTPLMVASSRGHREIVKKLLEHNPVIEAATQDGATALMFAAERCFLSICTDLVEAGASVNAETKRGVTPLSLAGKGKSIELVRLFIKKGADIRKIIREDSEAGKFVADEVAAKNSYASSNWVTY